jgi:hypothetical protein
MTKQTSTGHSVSSELPFQSENNIHSCSIAKYILNNVCSSWNFNSEHFVDDF